MNSGFPASLGVPAAVQLSEQYDLMEYSDFEMGQDSEDQKVFAIFLHGKRLVEPVKYQSKVFNKGGSNVKNRVVQSSYDRFFLFGDPKSNKVFAMFSANEKESRVLTRYHAHFSPGIMVAIIEPRIKGLMIDSTNLLICTSEPLIPIDTPCPISRDELPPYDLESETDIKWFHFCTQSLQLKFLVPTVDLCSGKFCDGQAAGSTTCVCVEKSGVKEWGLRGIIHSDELDITRTSHQKSTFTSVSFAKLCVLNTNLMRPQEATFNLILFRRNIKQFIAAVNNQEESPGFEVVGWFKPSKQEGESFFEVHEYHIISVKPLNNSLPDSVLQLRHPRPPLNCFRALIGPIRNWTNKRAQ